MASHSQLESSSVTRRALRARTGFVAGAGLAVVAALVACSGARPTELEAAPAADTLPAIPAPSASATEEPGVAPRPDGGAAPADCTKKDDADHDGDGISSKDGDCNDCDPKVRPGLIDVPGNGEDEDCSGKPDDDNLCDDGLALTSTAPGDAAKAIGLCKVAKGKSPGLVEAKWVKPDGSPLNDAESWGLLAKFGANVPQAGKTMLALSTGSARAPGDPGYVSPRGHEKNYTHGVPPGQPKPISFCQGTDPIPSSAHDGAALQLKIRVPVDAKSMSFTHQLFTSDYGSYACSEYNDTYVVLVTPKAPGAADANVAFDGKKDTLGVQSNDLLRACTPGQHYDLDYACPLGTASLAGTGFDGEAATGWLRTTVPVTGGSEITVLFAVWDGGDGILDTTVLVDDFSFSADAAASARTAPR